MHYRELRSWINNDPGKKSVKTIGIIGGGQLAWMMAPAARSLQLELQVQTPHATDPAVAIATHTIIAPLQNVAATTQLATQCDVITFENEFVDLAGLKPLADQGVQFFPSLSTLAPLLDKYDQRCYLHRIGLPTPNFIALDSGKLALQDWQNPFGFPVVLKVRRHGYDGRGTEVLSNAEALDTVIQAQQYQPLLLEAFVPFAKELAVMAARSPSGEIVTYPIVETHQKNQVCRVVIAPANVSPQVITQVQDIVHTLLTQLDAVGVFGIELFLTPEGTILVNEIAPRTHNSGHYSLDACYTSQFEQQLRAICGLPLGSPHLKCAGAVMVNLLGYEIATHDYPSQRQQLAQIPRSRVYWYGKAEARPGRKLGHVTILLEPRSALEREQEAMALVETIDRIWYPPI